MGISSSVLELGFSVGAGLERESESESGVVSLSLVIAAVNGWGTLGATLDSIGGMEGCEGVEVLVVDGTGGEVSRELGSRAGAWGFGLRVIASGDAGTIPAMRALGASRARGDLIGFLEDHVTVGRDWARRMTEAHASMPEAGAVGGAVENGRGGLVNWAAFFCEYTAYLEPVSGGSEPPGNNIVYKRGDLIPRLGVMREGRWESWINAELRDSGRGAAMIGGAGVRHIKGFGFRDFLAQRHWFSRSFAGMRRGGQGWGRRLVYGAGSAALPALLTWRAGVRVFRTGRRDLMVRFLLSAPLVALFQVSGALGEMRGYLFGAGDSLERVR